MMAHPPESLNGRLVSSLSRRSFIRHSVLACAAAALPSGYAQSNEADVVETTAGKVRGARVGGICTFKRIPYGASTAGTNRFMPPKAPVAWAGVRDVFELGPQCLQRRGRTPSTQRPPNDPEFSKEIAFVHQGISPTGLIVYSEDCLALNVWSPGLDQSKRPVMVWCHGGGFAGGSGGQPWCDGSNFACAHDVVVVTLNHRLNFLGYLYLGELNPEKYADSGNVGMLDIAAALGWVRDNIANFGGDPGNVTIAGHSGGVAKVGVLLAMPAAKGLFHKAIVQSGYALRMLPRVDAAWQAELLVRKLGLTANTLDTLQTMPWDKVQAALDSVNESMTGNPAAGPMSGASQFCYPVVDGRNLPAHPFDPGAPGVSAHVPLLMGNNESETTMLFGGGAFQIDESELRVRVKQLVKLDESGAHDLINAFRRNRQQETPSDLFFAISNAFLFRVPAIMQAERKAGQRRAPVYMSTFAWDAPAYGGKFRSSHGLSLPFMFRNLDKAPGLVGSDPDIRCLQLAQNASGAWAAFMRSGNPNSANLPEWKRYTVERRDTMVFDYDCKVVTTSDDEERHAIEPFVNPYA